MKAQMIGQTQPLLDWYDAHARALPWRAQPANPYHVLLSEFMLQQTVVATVIPYFERFTALWPDIQALAGASEDALLAEWAGLGYYARARNLHKAAREIDRQGAFPRTSSELQNLPGVGPYTAAAISAIAFNEPILPRDGNINRILARVFSIEDEINRPSNALEHAANAWAHPHRAGDLAQAMMDLGATICRPKNPKCALCPLAANCQAHQTNRTDELPNKRKAKPKKKLYAHAMIIEDNAGSFAYIKRDESALLGGMWALPTTEWREAEAPFAPPVASTWRKVGEVQHIFTHIDLRLQIWHTRTNRFDADESFTFFRDNEMPKSTLARLWQKARECYDNKND